jgi:hypothetical protein
MENNNILTKSKIASQKQSNKSSLVSIAPKLKNIPNEKSQTSN